jgi:hypothetical protein
MAPVSAINRSIFLNKNDKKLGITRSMIIEAKLGEKFYKCLYVLSFRLSTLVMTIVLFFSSIK